MHGRLKVKSTAEQLEAKRIEREKKLKLYNGATAKIFQKKKDGELDMELLALTGEVLSVNSDFYSLWNYRKEIFQAFLETRSTDDLQSTLQNELHFLESCLKNNPKSYGTWHHRCFVMNVMPTPDWPRELELCNQFLQYDERNFHCWDYRRHVVKQSNVSPEVELDFSMSKISNNFSNYSSWHYRSKLLPLIYPDPSQPMGVTEEALLREYELVQNGIFTDPDDQSNWFYHRWLMGRGEQTQHIISFLVSRQNGCLVVSLAKHIQLTSCFVLEVEVDGKRLDPNPKWYNHLGCQTFSTTWAADGVSFPEEDCNLKISLVEKNNRNSICTAMLELSKEEGFSLYRAPHGAGASQFSQELTGVKTETLEKELDSIRQLMEMETDNKWAILSAILLMKALDPSRYHNEMMTHLTSLEALDFKRRNYYLDLGSKYIIEKVIDNLDASSHSELNLSFKGQNLTLFYHTELLSFVNEIDLSENKLTQVKHFGHLQSVHRLCLDSNCIESCEGLGFMGRLEYLSLKNNCITNLDDLQPLQNCPRLTSLCLEGNPICETPDLSLRVQEILPDVLLISEQSS